MVKKKAKAHNPKGVQGNPTDTEWKKIVKFGQTVKKLRKSKDWTLESMEERGWRSWRHWQSIEAGKKNITIATILRISKVLKVPVKDLW